MSRPKYPPRRSVQRLLSAGEIARPIIGLDCDGTLGDYHGHFFSFARQYLGKHIPLSCTGGHAMNVHCQVSKKVYRETKLRYRNSGLKRAMPVFEGAVELVKELRQRGAEVIICTTRPFNRFDGIEDDTKAWLRRNKIPYDGIIAGEHKYRELVRRVGRERVVGVVDDLPEMLDQAQSLSLNAYMVSRPHNEGDYRLGFRLSVIKELLLEDLANWEKKQ